MRRSPRVVEMEEKARQQALVKQKELLDRERVCMTDFFSKIAAEASGSVREFSLVPDVLPISIPDSSTDFDLPVEIFQLHATAGEDASASDDDDDSLSYRRLKQNVYRAPLTRTTCDGEEVPLCVCTPVVGCGANCQNRLLFMECAAGYCRTLQPSSSNHSTSKSARGGLVHGKAASPSRRCRGVSGADSVDGNDHDSLNIRTTTRTSGVKTEKAAGASQQSPDEEEISTDNGSDEAESVFVPPTCSKYCANAVIQAKRYPQTEVFRTALCGFGLRVSEAVSEGTILGEYLGEVITAEECLDRIMQYDEGDDFYFASLQSGLVLDAKAAGSTARFANHSCDPSCELQKWSVCGEARIVLVSKKFMPVGTEITYNYQYFEDGLDAAVNMKRQLCRCGSAHCSGTIGGRAQPNLRAIWLTKAQSMLTASGRKVGLDACTEHINVARSSWPECAPGASHVPVAGERLDTNSESSELLDTLAQLEAIVRSAEIWEEKVEGLCSFLSKRSDVRLNVDGNLSAIDDRGNIVDSSSDATRINELIADAPQSLRLNGLSRLEEMIRLYERADKLIAPIYQNASTASRILLWDDAIAAARAVLAAWPMRVCGVAWLLHDLRATAEWSEAVLCLFDDSRRGSAGSSRDTPTLGPRRVKNNNSKDWGERSRSEWQLILKLSQLYDNSNCPAQMSTNDSAFRLNQFLEERLEQFTERSVIVKKREKELLKGLAGKSKSKSGASNEELHCFCQQLEDSAEINVLVQCDSCDEWYHPHCVNSLARDLQERRKSSKTPKRKQAAGLKQDCEEFVCPLCCHGMNVPSAFSHAPSTEWNITSDFSLLSEGGLRGFSKSSKQMISDPPRPASLVTPVPTMVCDDPQSHSNLFEPDQAAVCGELWHDGSVQAESKVDSIVDAPRDRNGVQAEHIDHSSFPVCPSLLLFVSVLKKRQPHRLPGCVGEEEISMALEVEKTIPIQSSPAALLLRLCSELVKEWKTRVSVFFSEPLVRQLAAAPFSLESLQMTKGDIKWSRFAFKGITQAQLNMEKTLLRECLRLYFELRVLRVHMQAELTELRKLAWTLSSATLIRSISRESDAAFDAGIDADLSNGDRLLRISLKELQLVLQGGAKVGCTAMNSVLYNALKGLSLEASSVLGFASQCLRLVDCEVSVRNLDNIARMVELEPEYPWARARNLILSHNHKLRAITHAATLTPSAEAQALSAVEGCPVKEQQTDQVEGCPVKEQQTGQVEACEVYCWCREGDRGQMVQCDHCQEWFHEDCVGLCQGAQDVSAEKLSKPSTKRRKSRVQLAESDSYWCIGCSVLEFGKYKFEWVCNYLPSAVKKEKKKFV